MENSVNKVTGKKRRRLEKYIDKKLKQEERSKLLTKLAHSQSTVNTSTLLPSSSLGSRKSLTLAGGRTKSLENETPKVIRATRVPKRKREPDEASQVSSGSEDDSSDSEEKEEEEQINAPREDPPVAPKLSFKEWAQKQLQLAKQPVPDVAQQSTASAPIPASEEAHKSPSDDIRTPQATNATGPPTGPLGQMFSIPSSSLLTSASSTKAVPVHRDDKIQAARLHLPIVSEEQTIMEAILINPIVVICGETGSGKTTQLPQFLYEAGFGTQGSENPGIIGITQPRRVAAMSMANRVALELGLPSSRVAYQIRYDATVSPSTIIKFMTDGVLLRELTTDFLLSKYSVVIIDEAHERSMNTDILIGILSRLVKLRQTMWEQKKDGIKPLRLIIMSATLRVEDFTSNPILFPVPPPVINITARQHPVTIHFSRKTASDYVSEAIRKVSQIHVKLPPGGILVFMTGQEEVTTVCRKLQAKFKLVTKKKIMSKSKEEPQLSQFSAVQADIEPEEFDLGDQALNAVADTDADTEGDSDDNSDFEGPGDDELPVHVLPLYSLLPSEKQLEVFQDPPSGSRLIVVATNIAETSLTIPNMRYVVDCGRVKERRYDSRSGIQSFPVSWISKASAAQRSGRAGRTGPGHCYRLYSSAFFENYFEDFTQPEILRVPVEGVVLQMKAMNIDAVVNFPFPTPPDRISLKKAEKTLINLGALEDKGGNMTFITNLGKAMAIFPLSPRFSKILVSAKQNGCLPFAIAIVSALASGDPFLRPEHVPKSANLEIPEEEEFNMNNIVEKQPRLREFYLSQQLHGSLGGGVSDVFRLLSVIGAFEFAGGGHTFCVEQFVRPKAMEEIHKLQMQLLNILRINFSEINVSILSKPPDSTQLKILRQLLAAAFVDQVAARQDVVDKASSTGAKYTSCRNVPYKVLGVSEDAFIHPSSVLYNSPPPEFIVFHDLVRTTKVWLKTNTVINPAWLPKLAPSLCSTSKRVKAFGGGSLIIPRFGPDSWELPAVREPEKK